LATVLQQQQRVVDQLVHRCVACNANNSTHKSVHSIGQKSPKFFRQHGAQALQKRDQHGRAF
jgi:hypothetical protein